MFYRRIIALAALAAVIVSALPRSIEGPVNAHLVAGPVDDLLKRDLALHPTTELHERKLIQKRRRVWPPFVGAAPKVELEGSACDTVIDSTKTASTTDSSQTPAPTQQVQTSCNI